MAPEAQELTALIDRVKKLEDQNRRLRYISMVAIVACLAIFVMGQAAPTRRVVEAQKFVLKDNDGKVRGWIGTIGKGSELILGNIDAQPMIRLIVSTDSSDLHFFGIRKSGLNFSLDSGNPEISVVGADGSGGAKIAFTEHVPSFTLEDGRGFSTRVGGAQLERPAQGDHLGSAASIILLDKDKKVIWRTP